MRVRGPALLAWGAAAASVLLSAAAIVLAAVSAGQARLLSQPAEAGSIVLAVVAPALGLIVVARQPRQAVGWLLIGIGLSQAVSNMGGEYATYALVTRPGSLPGGAFVSWLQTWTWIPGFALALCVLPLVFPDGRLVSRRWRPAVYASSVGTIVLLAVFADAAWPFRGLELVQTKPPSTGPVGLSILAGVVLLLCGGGAGVASLVVRLRSSGGQQRQQVKWFCFGAFVFVASQVLGQPFPSSVPVLNVIGACALLGGLGIALFRYRLYDIDRIISRTVAYAVLTGLLVALYAGLVTTLTRVLPVSSSLGVAVSTLAVAAVLQPLRRRIQHGVDRRFNRARYDAGRTVEAFSARLREQVYLDELSRDLLSVVRTTVQPASASLWLRGS
ncbi:MAG: hypothetical protein M3Z02_02285 [Actinomycetota bacterium]|nr:hypothetical protein [Actinomycetota bacterium]